MPPSRGGVLYGPAVQDDSLFYGLSPPPTAPATFTTSLSAASSASSSSLGSDGTAAHGSSTSSGTTASNPEIKRESSEERERLRCDSVADARLSICSTSGTVYESVVVVGHIYGTDNVVYYLLEVRSWEMPLDGYVIRRRYNDFKQLHQALADCMPQTGGVRRGFSPFGAYSSSLLCNPMSTAAPETSPLWSPTRPRTSSQRRSSITGLRLHGVEENAETPVASSASDRRFSVPTIVMPTPPPTNTQAPPASVPPMSMSMGGRPPLGHNPATHCVDLPFHTVSFDRTGRPLLPTMPSGGVSSFFTTREMLIKYRIEKFNKLLAAVLSDTSPSVAQLLMMFIQDKPSAPQSYVSLNQYAPLEMPWSVERHARRRAMSMGKKTLKDQLTAAAS